MRKRMTKEEFAAWAKSKEPEQKRMSRAAQTDYFDRIVNHGWVPKPVLDDRYRMDSSVGFVVDSLVALSQD